MTVFLRGISFAWIVAALAIFGVLLGLRAWLGYRRLTAEAEADWDYRVAHDMQDLRLDKAGFVRAFRKVNAPRLSLYLAGGAGLIIILTPVVFGLINVFLWGVWKFSNESRVFEPGYLVWEFSIFFGLIAAWALIGAAVARRYHANSPGLMRDAMMAERENFMPTRKLVVGPNPLHINGQGQADEYRKMFEEALGLNCERQDNWNQTGHICEIYSDGSDMNICVHSEGEGIMFQAQTHPFFFTRKHAKEDVEEARSTIVMCLDGAHDAFKKIETSDLNITKTTGNKHSHMRSISHENLDIFLYENSKGKK